MDIAKAPILKLLAGRWKEILCALAIAAAVLDIGRLLPNAIILIRARAAQPSPVPRTVRLRERITVAGRSQDGNLEVAATRSDGSRVIVLSREHETSPYHVRRILLASGSEIHVNDDFKLRQTVRFDFGAHQLAARNPESNCMHDTRLGGAPTYPEIFLGLETFHNLRTAKIKVNPKAAGDLVGWYALDYGCELVGQRTGFASGEVEEKWVESIAKGEPDPALFAVPEDYSEAPPSAWARRAADATGTRLSAADERRLAAQDRAYEKRRLH